MKVFMALAVCVGVSATTALAVSETPWGKCLAVEKALSQSRIRMRRGSVAQEEQAHALLAMKDYANAQNGFDFSEFEAAKKKVNRAQGVEVFGHVVNIGGLAAQIAVDKNASLEFLNRFERFKNSKTFQGLRTNKKRRLERAALSFAQSLAASALMRLGGFGYKNRVKNQFESDLRSVHGTTTDL
jgi:hypothetical protein